MTFIEPKLVFTLFSSDIYLCFIDYANTFYCMDHNKLWKILQEMGISDHLACLLRGLFNFMQNSVQFSSMAQSCLTLCISMNHSTPSLPVHHQLLEFTQIHVHGVGDAIQPSHPLLFPSPPASNPSQHQGLLQ